MTTSAPVEPTQRQVQLNTPFTDQKPGTSGLRKSSKQFEAPNYLESFVEAAFRTLSGVQGGTLVLGGDGRYGNRRAIDVILRMGAAHGLSKVIVTTGGILSTPAASNLIRQRKAIGGIILSASHNPGGPDGDFGVKVNGANGGPTPASFTDAVFECTKTLDGYKIVDAPAIPLDAPGSFSIGAMQVEVIDGVDDFVALMQELFNFDQIRDLIHSDFPLAFDAMHAVTGPYATRLFEGLLGAQAGSVRNGTPLEDFGKGHPDPNLTYAHELAELLLESDDYRFGAACDGDGDRNMILGQRCFVNPSDSLAVRRCSVAEIMAEHWKRFGRHYYSRHDYEAVASDAAHGLYDRLESMLPNLVGQAFAGRKISTADNFSYTDPVDGSVTTGQGLRILLDDGSRVVVRLSGTGTKGATIRVYLESYVPSSGDLNQDPQVALADMISAINDLAEIKQRTGMDQPTVIT